MTVATVQSSIRNKSTALAGIEIKIKTKHFSSQLLLIKCGAVRKSIHFYAGILLNLNSYF